MSIEVTIEDRALGKVAALVEACGDAGRAHLHTVAANAVANQIQRHIAYYARRKHITASQLGARPTGHFEVGSAAISSHGDSAAGTVVIPIPGIQRAWKDLVIRPKSAKALTIPKAAVSYGRRVAELEALGWTVFRPKGKNVLMGSNGGNTEVLYTLSAEVRQPKDPSLLPSKRDIGSTAAKSMIDEVMRIVRKARGAA